LQKAVKWNLGSEIEVADVEVFAISKALFIGLQKPDFDELYIFVDSQAAIKKLQKNYIQTEKIEKARKVAEALQKLGKKVVIRWTPSHCNIFGNEMADLFAKRGLEMKKSYEAYTSLSYIRHKMRKEDQINWEKDWYQAQQHQGKGLGKLYQKITQDSMRFGRKPNILKMPRKTQSAYIQLKTGIRYMKTYS